MAYGLQAAKLCNNLAMAISMLGVSEAFALGQSLGITASTLTKVFNSSSARCWSRYSTHFIYLSWIPLCMEHYNLYLFGGNSYKKMCDEGFGSKDFSCVFRHHYSGKDEN
ncbi:hypothetical protein GW17_00052403 [Ensete ventricosum]|nr:hypothetical protein GW17_00052403 [Ensete ventricosum]RZR99774.1 hypothetical protein BHM03_00029383 [Ensete ventricosum]